VDFWAKDGVPHGDRAFLTEIAATDADDAEDQSA
jgi:hypothetical protein